MRRFPRQEAFTTEAELCQVAIESFRAQGWEVWQEILGVDIVLRRPGETAILAVEAKLSLNPKVLEQAWERRNSGMFDASYVLVPGPYYGVGQIPRFWAEVMRALGLGCWAFTPEGDDRVTLILPARDIQRVRKDVERLLVPEAQDHTQAGKPSCKQWNEYDMLELKICAWLKEQAEADFFRYRDEKKVPLDHMIKDIFPRFVGKKGAVLQKGREYVMQLCGGMSGKLKKRWTKFEVQRNQIWLKEWEDIDREVKFSLSGNAQQVQANDQPLTPAQPDEMAK